MASRRRRWPSPSRTSRAREGGIGARPGDAAGIEIEASPAVSSAIHRRRRLPERAERVVPPVIARVVVRGVPDAGVPGGGERQIDRSDAFVPRGVRLEPADVAPSAEGRRRRGASPPRRPSRRPCARVERVRRWRAAPARAAATSRRPGDASAEASNTSQKRRRSSRAGIDANAIVPYAPRTRVVGVVTRADAIPPTARGSVARVQGASRPEACPAVISRWYRGHLSSRPGRPTRRSDPARTRPAFRPRRPRRAEPRRPSPSPARRRGPEPRSYRWGHPEIQRSNVPVEPRGVLAGGRGHRRHLERREVIAAAVSAQQVNAVAHQRLGVRLVVHDLIEDTHTTGAGIDHHRARCACPVANASAAVSTTQCSGPSSGYN